jgi:hypothetical protein
MPNLPEDIEQGLVEVYGQVGATFIITQTPQGGAPEEIKEQWVGTTLPVRNRNLGQAALSPTVNFDYLRQQFIETDDPVSITGIDAVQALRDAGKEEAARFWEAYQLASFVFRAHEGTLEPLQPE